MSFSLGLFHLFPTLSPIRIFTLITCSLTTVWFLTMPQSTPCPCLHNICPPLSAPQLPIQSFKGLTILFALVIFVNFTTQKDLFHISISSKLSIALTVCIKHLTIHYPAICIFISLSVHVFPRICKFFEVRDMPF